MNKTIYGLLLLSVWICGCNDIMEEDISNVEINLISPLEGYQYDIYNQAFWWEKSKKTELYHLQIVEGDFQTVKALILDTVIKTTQFNYTLFPASFEWRVRAINGAYESGFSTRKLVIVPGNIEDQRVQLKEPLNSTKLNSMNLTFTWYSIRSVENYRLQIDNKTGSFSDNNLILDTLFDAGSENQLVNLNYVNSIKGEYKWRVRAESFSSESKYSEIGNFLVDNSTVILKHPTNGERISNPVLSWETNANNRFKLFAKDSSGANIAGFPKEIVGNSFQWANPKANDKIYWTVASIDHFDNISDTASSISFIVSKNEK
jgi:hypothetical protein